jgi:hypothetical protein
VLVVTALELRIPEVSSSRNPTTNEIAIRMKMILDALRICCSTERYSWRAVGGTKGIVGEPANYGAARGKIKSECNF